MKNNKSNASYNRARAVAEIADSLNLSYTPTDEFGLINLLKDFKLYKTSGRRKQISNIMSEKSELNEVDIRIFDFEYTGIKTKPLGIERSVKDFRQTVFFVQSKKLTLPKFYMEPERFFHKASTFLGIDDIDFEAYPAFSDQYWLKGKDEAAIRESMKEEILRFFTIEKYWNLEAINYYLIFYSKNRLFFGEQLEILYKKGKQIVEMFSED